MLLRFFRLGILAFEVGERHVQRFVTEADSGGVWSPSHFETARAAGNTVEEEITIARPAERRAIQKLSHRELGKEGRVALPRISGSRRTILLARSFLTIGWNRVCDLRHGLRDPLGDGPSNWRGWQCSSSTDVSHQYSGDQLVLNPLKIREL